MKKLFTVLVCLLMASSSAMMAQTIFAKGDKVVNLSLGLGNTIRSDSFLKTTVPPLMGSFEYGVKDELFDDKSSLGVGGYLGFFSQKMKDSAAGDLKYTDIIFGVRGNLHYQFIDKLDTYAGLGIGYDVVSSSGSYIGAVSSSSLNYDLFVGARYYFTENFAAMAEAGYTISALSVGIAVKF